MPAKSFLTYRTSWLVRELIYWAWIHPNHTGLYRIVVMQLELQEFFSMDDLVRTRFFFFSCFSCSMSSRSLLFMLAVWLPLW